eukprot:3822058-Amphidinium_carterae.1
MCALGGGYKVVVFRSGGTYSTDSFYTPGLDEGVTPGGLALKMKDCPQCCTNDEAHAGSSIM